MACITRWKIGDIVYIKCDDDTLPREPNRCEVVNMQHLKTLNYDFVTYGVNRLNDDIYAEYSESELEDI